MPTTQSLSEKSKSSFRETLSGLFRNWQWILSFTKGARHKILIYSLLGLFSTSLSLIAALLSKELIDCITALDTPRLIPCISALLVCGVAATACGSVSGRISAKLQVSIQNKIHLQLFDALLSAQWEDLLKFSSGDLINRFASDVHTVGSCACGWVPKLLVQCFTAAASLAVVAWFDPVMALLLCCSVPVIVLSSHKLIQKLQHHNRQMRTISSRLSSYESEVIRNIDTLKSFHGEASVRYGMENHLNELASASLEHNLFTIRTSLWMKALSTALQYLTLGYCLWRLWQGQLQWGTLVLFLQQHGTLTSAFSALVSMIPSALSGSVSAERLMELTDMEQEAHCQQVQCSCCTIQASHVHAGYKAKPNVLADISFTLHPGQTVALTGPSGQGKTTLLRLLLSLIPVASGSLTLTDEGGNSYDVSPATRNCFTYVPQGNTMMAASVADNLRLGNPEATEMEMIQALQAACAWEFVEPLGLNTVVGEGGKGFSQGQAQRLSIARALLRKAPVLLLDEATSDLDPETEARVLENLSQLGKTCILTTHRSTVSDRCDSIYRIENGNLNKIK